MEGVTVISNGAKFKKGTDSVSPTLEQILSKHVQTLYAILAELIAFVIPDS